MARRLFFVDSVRNGRAVLEGDDARHLARVLRAEAGQRYELSDNRSRYLAEIEEVRRTVVFRILETLPVVEPPVRVSLYASLIKFDRLEGIFEKATELGVERIVPVAATRSEKGLDKAAGKRLERWRRIVLESSQQCRRARLPVVEEARTFEAACREAESLRYVLEEEAGSPALLSALPEKRSSSDSVSLLVGPEGGWTEEERELARAAGWKAVSLGPQILRSETAAVAALAVVVSAWVAE